MAATNATEIGAFLKSKIQDYAYTPLVYEQGNVHSSMDGVVQVSGLHSRYGEIIAFENNVYGMALELREDGVGTVLLNGTSVPAGSNARGTGHVVDVCTGENLLGRVIDPLGRPLDGKRLDPLHFRPVENPAPAIMDRASVNTPMETGILAIDSMIPIGRGQRELILGDRQTGKTALALAAMMNQRASGVLCVYCAIGQKASTVASLVRELTRSGAIDHTVVVVSGSSDPPAMQYLAPYAGCTIAEDFMYAGRDVLIVYDDLSKHAVAYRTMSLLLRRPSGREAYPGDVFYLHSRLLERAAKLGEALGGGSMTALPIVETVAGDISAYIPTNIISITDGQIHLESELFHAGIRPAVNVGLSVSRVGRAAQTDAMKKVSGSLRLDVAQYRDMSVFAQFGADIDEVTKNLLLSGERLIELLKQRQDQLFSLSEQVAILITFSCGCFKDVPLERVNHARFSMLSWLKDSCAAVLNHIDETGSLSNEDRAEIETYARSFVEMNFVYPEG